MIGLKESAATTLDIEGLLKSLGECCVRVSSFKRSY